MKIKSVNINDYQSVVESYPQVVVHFWADWSLHDKGMRERLIELSEVYGDSIKIASFDTLPEQHWEKCHELNISNLPALVFYKHGKFFDKVIGLGSKEKTVAEFDKLVKEETC